MTWIIYGENTQMTVTRTERTTENGTIAIYKLTNQRGSGRRRVTRTFSYGGGTGFVL